jgi:hypothetical protein
MGGDCCPGNGDRRGPRTASRERRFFGHAGNERPVVVGTTGAWARKSGVSAQRVGFARGRSNWMAGDGTRTDGSGTGWGRSRASGPRPTAVDRSAAAVAERSRNQRRGDGRGATDAWQRCRGGQHAGAVAATCVGGYGRERQPRATQRHGPQTQRHEQQAVESRPRPGAAAVDRTARHAGRPRRWASEPLRHSAKDARVGRDAAGRRRREEAAGGRAARFADTEADAGARPARFGAAETSTRIEQSSSTEQRKAFLAEPPERDAGADHAGVERSSACARGGA